MELILEIFLLWIREKYFFFCTFALKEMTYVSELRPIVWAVEDTVYLGFAWFLFHFRYIELLSFLNNLQILLQLSLLSSTAVFCWRTLYGSSSLPTCGWTTPWISTVSRRKYIFCSLWGENIKIKKLELKVMDWKENIHIYTCLWMCKVVTLNILLAHRDYRNVQLKRDILDTNSLQSCVHIISLPFVWYWKFPMPVLDLSHKAVIVVQCFSKQFLPTAPGFCKTKQNKSFFQLAFYMEIKENIFLRHSIFSTHNISFCCTAFKTRNN